MEIRERLTDWTHPSFLIDWFLDSEFHVILCQGIHNQMFGVWKPIDCVEELKRLEFHSGFPSGNNLRDPVFNGNKFEYLCAASEYCNPSFKIPLNIEFKSELFHGVLENAKAFLEEFKNYEGENQQGFILKAPFVQNQQGFNLFYFRTYDQLVSKVQNCFLKDAAKAIGKLHVKTADVFPYLIIQPRMISTNESKVILWNGKAKYISVSRRGIIGSKNGTTVEALFQFVEEAWSTLMKRTGGAFLGDGLSRVDCFLSAKGKLVVNEFENLDANISGSSKYECRTPTYLCEYYVSLLASKLVIE
jgi:hypothetical protein